MLACESRMLFSGGSSFQAAGIWYTRWPMGWGVAMPLCGGPWGGVGVAGWAIPRFAGCCLPQAVARSGRTRRNANGRRRWVVMEGLISVSFEGSVFGRESIVRAKRVSNRGRRRKAGPEFLGARGLQRAAGMPGTRVILNPSAGGGSGADRDLRERLAALPGVEVCETSEPGAARRLAKQAVAAGCRRLVAAGGDGTLNEVLNGLAPDFGRAEVALVPAGTGNDLARSLGLPEPTDEALAVLAAGHTRALDLARLDDGGGASRYFANASAGGFSGEVDERMDEQVKAAWGPLSYLRSAVAALPELEPYRTTLVLEPGTPEEERLELALVNLVVANGRFVAGGVAIAPEASTDDGLLDLVAIRAAPIARLAGLASKVLLGQHLGDELVVHRKFRRLDVRSRPPMPCNADGETGYATPLGYRVLPAAVRFVVP